MAPKATVLVSMAAAAIAAVAYAKDYTIVQRNGDFVEKAISIKVGETIWFANEDDYGHNVYSSSPANVFDFGRQRPGQRTPVQFKQPGTVDVYCRIHPKMHLKVTVQP
jgi:plastocyanin